MGAEMITEGGDSKARMMLMTKSFLKELQADVAEETAEKENEAKLEHADPKWMRLAHKYRKEHAKEGASQDEKVGRDVVINTLQVH
jgi:hypothetical protein